MVERLRGAQTTEERAAARHILTTVTRRSKREWANQVINRSNVWDVAQWRHGRRMNIIPALKKADGTLTFEHDKMADIFAERFFARERDTIPLVFDDDPPVISGRPFPPLTMRELVEMLGKTSNKSAPGSSGFNWKVLKWAWPFIGETLRLAFEVCLHLGHHPRRWKEAVVTVIPKPGRPDYALAKTHCPISLLECMSKLLEKVIANRLQHDITALDLVPTNQFGGRQHSLCLDVGVAV